MAGSVSVGNARGKLRIYWTFDRKRYFIHTGMPDTAVNRLVAESKAKQIEADCATGNFDKTLSKYKSKSKVSDCITCSDLFSRFTAWKGERIHPNTMGLYFSIQRNIDQVIGPRLASSVTENDAIKFRDFLLSQISPVTAKSRIGRLKACWEWAIAAELIQVNQNPWNDIPVRVPPKQKPKPFTLEEVNSILDQFLKSKHYGYYSDYVRFLFGTGVRTGEGIGLLWEHVSDDCSQVWIGKTYTRGILKETKTKETRLISLPRSIRQLLENRSLKKQSLIVFPSKVGGFINDGNFRGRVWKTCLKRAGVDYRKPYMTRSTFISHALAGGMNPVDVAYITGHDVKVLYSDYAGSIESTPKAPEMKWSRSATPAPD